MKNNLENDKMELDKEENNNNDVEMLNFNKNLNYPQMERIEINEEEQMSHKSDNFDNILYIKKYYFNIV